MYIVENSLAKVMMNLVMAGEITPLSDGQSPVADYQVAYTLLNRRRSASDSIRQQIEELPLTKISPSDEWADFYHIYLHQCQCKISAKCKSQWRIEHFWKGGSYV